MGSLSATKTVEASLHFLVRDDLYKEEKPYTLRYSTPDDINFPRTNSKHEEVHGVSIEDIRGRETDFSLIRNGFMVTGLDGEMSYEDFADKDKVMEVYLPAVARRLREVLNAKHVQVYEHTIRRRDATYPISTGKVYEFDQPTNTAHIDVTESYVQQLSSRINATLPEDLRESMRKRQVQCINIWKPLRGPLTDWPLCVCDATTVNAEDDLIPSDQVFPQHVVENIQVHFNKGQKWYYLSDQNPDEIWMFCQSIVSSAGGLNCGTPHCSFSSPDIVSNGQLRESIECRALVYSDKG